MQPFSSTIVISSLLFLSQPSFADHSGIVPAASQTAPAVVPAFDVKLEAKDLIDKPQPQQTAKTAHDVKGPTESKQERIQRLQTVAQADGFVTLEEFKRIEAEENKSDYTAKPKPHPMATKRKQK